MLRLLLIACFTIITVSTVQPVLAGGPLFGGHAHCNHSCCKTEVIYVTPKKSCDDGGRSTRGNESANVSNVNAPVVASYPMMPMFAPMYAGYAPPVQYGSYPRPRGNESARVNDNPCCDQLRSRVDKVETAIESIDQRLSEVEDILKLQTQLLKQIKEANEGS